MNIWSGFGRKTKQKFSKSIMKFMEQIMRLLQRNFQEEQHSKSKIEYVICIKRKKDTRFQTKMIVD